VGRILLIGGSEDILISTLRRDSLSSPSEVAMTTVDVFYLRFTSAEENVKSIYFQAVGSPHVSHSFKFKEVIQTAKLLLAYEKSALMGLVILEKVKLSTCLSTTP
jgi:hypothetical protein